MFLRPPALVRPALAQRGGTPVSVVVPYTAGSAPDLFGRLLTEHLRQLFEPGITG